MVVRPAVPSPPASLQIIFLPAFPLCVLQLIWAAAPLAAFSGEQLNWSVPPLAPSSLQPWIAYLPLFFVFVFLCLYAHKCVSVRAWARTCVCVYAGDMCYKNSWITEARQDFWTALEQMVVELDQGIKTPEMENASVADGWDCGIVSWGLGAWALLCSVFPFPSLPQKEMFLPHFWYL